MEKENKNRSVTIRVQPTLYKKLTDKAIQESVKEGRIVKVSEIITLALENSI